MTFLYLVVLCVLSVGVLAQIEKIGAPKLFFGSQTTKADADFENEMLNGHNAYRAKHGVPPLTLNRDICNWAQEWADHLAATQSFLHRPNNIYGENLWGGTVTPGKSSIDSWYNEIYEYDWNKPGLSMQTNYFTQVVWKNSKEFGVAKAQTDYGWWYVVANYNPPGNYAGQFEENVPKPIA